MREKPTRRLQDEFALLDWSRAHRTPIQVRYSDMDAMGHLNNTVYVQYLEVSRMRMMRDLQRGTDSTRSVVARLELDYAHEIKLEQEVVVETLVERVGNKSWSSLSRILADGQPSAFARTVEVLVDSANTPVPLSEWLRDLLEMQRPVMLEP